MNSRCGDGLGFCKASNVAGKPPVCTLCGVGSDETQFECCPGVIQWPSILLFSKSNELFLGYFDSESMFPDSKKIYFQG